MKKAFTLIEMLVVIVILGILLGMTMKFGGDRIDDLKAQTHKEEFVQRYSSLYAQNLASSYYQSERYHTLRFTFASGVSYLYDSGVVLYLVSDASQYITGLRMDGAPITQVNLYLTPYRLGCQLGEGTGSLFQFELMVNTTKQYCFHIAADTCALQEDKCK